MLLLSAIGLAWFDAWIGCILSSRRSLDVTPQPTLCFVLATLLEILDFAFSFLQLLRLMDVYVSEIPVNFVESKYWADLAYSC
jgi:hypothetical protein